MAPRVTDDGGKDVYSSWMVSMSALRERGVLRAQAETEGKPENVIEKMVEGRLNKFFKEVVLLEQQLVMDPDSSVKNAVAAAGAEVVAFRRFQLGEEIGE